MAMLLNLPSFLGPDVSTAAAAPDAFWLGANVPWNQFGYDIGSAYNASFFDGAFGAIAAAGANSARFWMHADGRATPSFAADGSVSGPGGASYADDLQSLASLAAKHGLVLELCLWSFDMCKKDFDKAVLHDDLISDAAKSKSYVDNALVPYLKALAGAENVVIEVVNEPEWCMKGSCNTQKCVEVSEMQRFTAMIAEAVHAHSSFKVTTGSASLKWSSVAQSGLASYWNDTALASAYPSGKHAALDFYNVHYYDWMYDPSWGYDPCRLKAEAWALDKPTVIAELPASSAHYSAAQLLSCSSDNGFAGDLFWAYNDASFPLGKAVPAMKDFAAAHKDATSYSALLKWLGALGTAAAPPTPRARVAAASVDAAAEATVEAPPAAVAAAAPLAASRKAASRDAFVKLLRAD